MIKEIKKTNLVAVKNQIESVKKFQQEQLKNTKHQGELDYQAAIEQNNQKLNLAQLDYESKLLSIKEKLDQSQNFIEAKEHQLKNDHHKKMEQEKNQHKIEFLNIQDDNRESMARHKDKMNRTIEKLEQESLDERKNIENKNQNQLSFLATTFEQKSIDEEKNFRNKLGVDLQIHRDLLKQNQDQLKKSLYDTQNKNKYLAEEKNKSMMEERAFQERFHKNLLTQKQNDFNTKYNQLTTETEKILNDIEFKSNQIVNKAKSELSQKLNSLETKSKDPFYQIEKLEPQITEKLNHYEINLPVPKHEKEDVHLSINGRKIKLTYSKKFNEHVTDEFGSINRTSKGHLYSKELNVDHLLNPKNIGEKYSDGILSFKVAKL